MNLKLTYFFHYSVPIAKIDRKSCKKSDIRHDFCYSMPRWVSGMSRCYGPSDFSNAKVMTSGTTFSTFSWRITTINNMPLCDWLTISLKEELHISEVVIRNQIVRHWSVQKI